MYFLGNVLHVSLEKARLPVGQNFQKVQFHAILMFSKLKSYLELCFLIFFISDIQTSFQLNRITQH